MHLCAILSHIFYLCFPTLPHASPTATKNITSNQQPRNRLSDMHAAVNYHNARRAFTSTVPLFTLQTATPMNKATIVVVCAYLGLTLMDTTYDALCLMAGLPRVVHDIVIGYAYTETELDSCLCAYHDFDDLAHECLSEAMQRHSWQAPRLTRCLYGSDDCDRVTRVKYEPDRFKTCVSRTYYIFLCVWYTPHLLRVNTHASTGRVQLIYMQWASSLELTLFCGLDHEFEVKAVCHASIGDQVCSFIVRLSTVDTEIPWRVQFMGCRVPVAGVTIRHSQFDDAFTPSRGSVWEVTDKAVQANVYNQQICYTLSFPRNTSAHASHYRVTYQKFGGTEVTRGACNLDRSPAALDATDARTHIIDTALRSVRVLVSRMLAQAQYVLHHWRISKPNR